MKTRYAIFILCFLLFSTSISGQRLAVINSDDSEFGAQYAEKLHGELSSLLRVADLAYSRSVVHNSPVENKLNLTTDEAKQIGETIGCDFYILIKVVNHPRNAFGQKFYHEATAAIFFVSTRTGSLKHWLLEKFEKETPKAAADALIDSVTSRADWLAKQAIATLAEEIEAQKKETPAIYSPDGGDTNQLRPPMPYRRISPAYTPLADLFAVKATVDAEVDIDENGNVTNVAIIRWAGYGLDESVKKTIREMNWRRGEQHGKPLAMRILLRYNFIKVNK